MTSPATEPRPFDLLDTADLAARLFPRSKSPARSVWNWKQRYTVPTLMVGGRLRFRWSDVLDVLRDTDRVRRRSQAAKQALKGRG